MKNIIKGIGGLFLLVVLFTACSPDSYDHPSEAGLPKISEMDIRVTVGEKNVVTFRVENKGVVPMWTFDDGSSYVGNDYKKTYREAGIYSVEVKVYNSNGISDGSVTKDFTVTETLETEDGEYLALIAGGGSKTWVWDMATSGHFGCGESGTEGLNWWSAGPYEKAGFGMQDDEMTFTAQRKYTFDPGPDGMIYVNADSGYRTEYATGEDYDAPCDKMTVDYWFEEDGDDLYLVFPANTVVSYIPNPEGLQNPRFRVLTLEEDLLVMTLDNGGIAWHYRFIPKAD